MEALFEALGIDTKLLLAQSVNFGVVLIVLTFLVYRPLLRVIQERKNRIIEGLHGAEEAEKRLRTIDAMREETMIQARSMASALIAESEKKATVRGDEMIKSAERKSEELLEKAAISALAKKEKEMDAVYREAKYLLRDALARAVGDDPAAVDAALIEKAERALKSHKVSNA